MLMQILTHTPPWVFVLFVALVSLGGWLLRERTVSVRRVYITPVVFLIWSFSSVISVFKDDAALASILFSWAASYGVMAWLVSRMPPKPPSCYEPKHKRFIVAGSVIPLLLMMGIFFLRYALAVSLAMQASYAQSLGFLLVIAALYGALSAGFAGRAWGLIRLIPTSPKN